MAHVHSPPDLTDLWARIGHERLTDIIRDGTSSGKLQGEYLHWDKLRHLAPPASLSTEEWWWLLKIQRAPSQRPIPLADAQGQSFVYSTPDEVLRSLHDIDLRCAGTVAMPEVVTGDEQARRHYLVSTLMEEAIRSSQLEGATTSRRAAKELLRTGRAPKDRSERMVLNNYRAMNLMREGLGERLTPVFVLELHRVLTQGTLDDPAAAGRLQTAADDRVAVYDNIDGSLVHAPPPAQELPDRLARLCVFANAEDELEGFLHPVVRAILVHFWLAFDHPFEDGNGRTARALFYWSMLRQGYWLTEYLSISRILRQAPAQYSRAFMLTETDSRDTTYFILHQLSVIARAIDEMDVYLRRKTRELRAVDELARASGDLNHRQRALLGDAARNPERRYGFASHAASHGVTHETARTDLLRLKDKGLLVRGREGRTHVFSAAPDLGERLAPAGATGRGQG